MPVIHPLFIFTRIHKTGSTSLVKMLGNVYTDGSLELTKPDHVPLRQLDSSLLDSRFKFTIVRNPFARLYSWYQNYLRTLIKTGAEFPMFEKYFANRVKEPHFWQEHYLQEYSKFDRIYQTEKFEDMVTDLEIRLNKNLYPIIHFGSEHQFNRDYRPYYSPNMIDIVVQNEPTLMEHFNYSF